MPRVKICSVQRVADALIAAEAGADFIGLIFVPNRRRRISVEQARRIVDAVKATGENRPKAVGIFADQPLSEVKATVRRVGVDVVQLCGSESMKFCDETPAPVLRVVHVPGGIHTDDEVETLARRMRELKERGHSVTLDRAVGKLQGGTGQSFDWGVAARLSKEGFDFMLAGGLTPENVGRAVREVNPWGVDVSSGVETDGMKDAEKIRRFVSEAKRASE